MAKFLVPSLLPCKPPMFYRSKWTNFQYAYEWSGLLVLCHSLMKPMLSQFFGVQLYDEPASAAQASSDGDAQAQALPDEELVLGRMLVTWTSSPTISTGQILTSG